MKTKVDVYVLDRSGEVLSVAKNVSTQKAAKFCQIYAKQDKYRGTVQWPHGEPFPENLVVREPGPSRQVS